LDEAELQLSYTKIYAPEAGRVTRKSVELGALVQVGQPLLAIVPGEVWVTANFKESQIGTIRPGQSAEITVDAYSDKTFKAHVDSIQAGTGARFSLIPAENATGNYVKVVQRIPVKIVFDEPPDPQHLLAPGMSVVPQVKVK
jgi:membrane fusion protein (multidrug efflux system)